MRIDDTWSIPAFTSSCKISMRYVCLLLSLISMTVGCKPKRPELPTTKPQRLNVLTIPLTVYAEEENSDSFLIPITNNAASSCKIKVGGGMNVQIVKKIDSLGPGETRVLRCRIYESTKSGRLEVYNDISPIMNRVKLKRERVVESSPIARKEQTKGEGGTGVN